MDDTSIQTRNRAVLSHLGLARHVSRQENKKGPESADDLFQEACLGLVRGMDQYNPNLGYKPSSYLVRRCQGQILHYRRDRARTIRIPWRLRDLAVKGQRLQERDLHDGKLNLQPKDIADALGVSLQRWEQAQLVSKPMKSAAWRVYNHPLTLSTVIERIHNGIGCEVPCTNSIVVSKLSCNDISLMESL